MKALTYTNTKSFTKSRTDVLNDHFEMFLRCSNMSDHEVNNLLEAAEMQEISAVGIYIEEGNFRVAEVEFEVDWKMHNELVNLKGRVFNTDIAGWKNGIAPEAYVSAQHLVNTAKRMGLPVRSWIRVSPVIRSNVEKHKQVCNKLGYCYGSSVVPWKDQPDENIRQINGLEEAKVSCRARKKVDH